jgi:gas vesicle protein
MGIVTREQLIKGFQADSTGMSAVIAAVFAAGLVISFLAARQLHSEWQILTKIWETGNIPKAKRESDLAAVFGKLARFKEKGEEVDIYAAIDTYHSRHNSRVRSVSILAALVISMGLLGTVVGLIMSISGLGGMVENIGLSRTTLMTALKATVAGMGTAFYTTFFGALGGLILRAVAVSQLNSLSELCAEATEYATAHLKAKLESKEEELNKKVSKVIAGFDGMQKEIEAITGRLTKSFESIMSSFGDALAEAGNHAMVASKDCVAGMAEQVAAEVGKEISSSFVAFNKSMDLASKDVRKTFRSINTSISRYGDKLDKTFEGVDQVVQNGSGEIKESFDEFKELIKQASEDVHDAFGIISQRLASNGDQVVESFNCITDAVNESTDMVGESLADFKLSLDASAQSLKDSAGNLHSAISSATGEIKSLSEARLNAEAAEIAGHLTLAANTIQEFVSKTGQIEKNKKVA